MKGTVLAAGLGLIGGSLCISIKKAHPDCTIIGFDRKKEEQKRAKELGVIDEEACSFEEAAEAADLIILAAPVNGIVKLIEKLKSVNLKENVLITDAGSVKSPIMKASKQLAEKGAAFIGGHPMAGSHKSGVIAAKDLLFENAYYILTPGDGTSEEKSAELQRWLEGTRAKFLILDPSDHDELTGVVSHFPHLIASSLVHTAMSAEDQFPYISRLAAGGFKDTTRIASADPQMWSDITLQNNQVLLKLLREWKESMDVLIERIEGEDKENVFRFFSEAKTFRDGLPVKSKGAIPAFYDLYVDIPDNPGVIAEITGLLAKEQISLTNIRVLEMREDSVGRLVISFQNNTDLERSKKVLIEETSFEVF
ncbi:prephenate dehydrogenase [Rossellomorea vietnamensis]|uniref:Prephenate dehydrogenase n=1 Tax=Rossellomorea aquimaris TaxID=189382 RepID=A0A5D4TVW2_9BACI|nr:prephenate dehydrogenase [Rossellomorea aquimaris]TYS79289.1 prephenate dehydrogenase [Rossellomorea aquimaris]